MPAFFKKKGLKVSFEKKILRKNDISLLILDERWNSLFNTVGKTPRILACEEKLRNLLKEQARLTSEAKALPEKKKRLMDKIIKLTPEAYEQNSEKARDEMAVFEKEIKEINARIAKAAAELERIPDSIKEINLKLLEYTVNEVYFKIRESQRRVQELDKLIESMKEQLKNFIDEKESLAQGDIDVYSYFHDLLGAEELERLDKLHFGK